MEAKCFQYRSYVSTKKQVVCRVHFLLPTPTVFMHFRFRSALVWTIVSELDFLVSVPFPPIQPYIYVL